MFILKKKSIGSLVFRFLSFMQLIKHTLKPKGKIPLYINIYLYKSKHYTSMEELMELTAAGAVIKKKQIKTGKVILPTDKKKFNETHKEY